MSKRRHSGDSTQGSNERRSAQRYAIKLGVRCSAQKPSHVVFGTTRDLSSSGISFTTGEVVACGTPVELSIEWPFLLQQTCALQLRVLGNVVRCTGECVAVRIEKYGFHTRRFGTGES